MASANEDVLQKLAPSIVEIISDKGEGEESSTTLGTGFVVTDDGLVVTCRHVVTESEDLLMDTVRVRFYSDLINSAGGKKDTTIDSIPIYTMNLIKEFTKDPSVDIAFFKLDVKSSPVQNKKLTPVELDDKPLPLNHFASIGFKKAEEFTGLGAKGEIRILTHIKNSDGSLSPEVIQLHGQNEIEPGMSGAPVLDIERDRVIGIITERYIEQYDQAASSIAFALPVKSMVDLCPVLREKNPGLTVLSKFLRAIGEEVETSIYKWIDEVYVPPNEYEEIKDALKSKRIVLITGTKEFGKTFTAVKLMYDYFREGNLNSGYTPRWIRAGKQPGREGADPRDFVKLQTETHIKPHEIIYFEDPFGRTKYERSDELEDRFGSIIDSINNIQDVYVVITSREEVFKEFEKEQLSSVELANFEKKLNLKKGSYSTEKKKEMVCKWAKVYNCKWLLYSDLTDLILDATEIEEMLPTPLNIKDFIVASVNVLDSKKLRDLMKQKSEETARRFGVEIIRMEEDEKVLFLAFAYVGSLTVEFVEKIYDSIIISWKESSQKYFTNFERIKHWFEGDKINVTENNLAFSHPSYHEAFQYAIDSDKRYSDKINSDRIRHIFAKSLVRLVDEKEPTSSVAHAITYNFRKLPSDVQQLLFQLADNNNAALGVAYAIGDNFNNLPSNIREQLLLKLADKDKAALIVGSIIADSFDGIQLFGIRLTDTGVLAPRIADSRVGSYFNNLPSNIREQLLVKLQDKAPRAVAYAITSNFNNLPSHIQQLLFKLADNDTAAWSLTRGIVANFNNLPSHIQQLLFKLADNDTAAEDVADTITDNFNNLPSNIREQLLIKLAEKHVAAGYVVDTVTINFNKLPAKVQEILFKLADSDKAAWTVAHKIEDNFNNLPSNIREQLLLKLADNNNAAWNVGNIMESYFNNLPSNIREQLLVKLQDKAPRAVAYAITSNFNNLPSHIQQLLFKLADNDTAEAYVARAITDNFNNLPSNIREQLLLKLADKERAGRNVAVAIASNFNNLPSHIQQLLFKLADRDSLREIVSSAIKDYGNNIPEQVRKEIFTKLEGKDTT